MIPRLNDLLRGPVVPIAVACAVGLQVAEPRERAESLVAVEGWPSPEGLRFVERYARDGGSLAWMVETLRLGAFELGEVTEPRRAALVETLRRAPWGSVGPEIHASSGSGAEGAVENGLWLLGELGDASEVATLVDLVTSPGSDAGPEVLSAFEQALAAIMARDSRAAHLVRDLFDDRHRALWPHVAAGIGRSGQTRALGPLEHLLNRDSELDALLLSQIGALGAQVDPVAEWSVCLAVRAYLIDSRPELRREAALTLGKLRDSDSVDALLGLLEDPSRGVRSNALWALRQISAQDLGQDPGRWRNWYREELAWWQDEYPALLETISRGEAGQVGPAVSAMTGRRLFRHRMAADLSVLLQHDAPEVRRRACVALRELGSLAASRELVAALTDADEGVRREAHAALCATSGLDLIPRPEAWIQALELDR